MKFWKMNVAGNDVILLNQREEQIPMERLPAMAKNLCTRRLSVGADGFAALDAAEQGGDLRMRYYHGDGTEGVWSGNGLACLCRFAYENGLCGEKMRVETPSGTVQGQRISESLYRVCLPEPRKDRSSFPIHLEQRILSCSYMEFGAAGTSCAVMEVQNLRGLDDTTARQLCREMQKHKVFPKGTDVHFFDWIGDGRVYLKSYRQTIADFVMASGTGGAAVAYILLRQGRLPWSCLEVESVGGVLTVEAADVGLSITVPTKLVAKGEFTE